MNPETPLPDLTALLDEALVSAFLESVPDLVYFKDRDRRFLAVSSSTSRVRHLTPADLVGRTDAELGPDEAARRTQHDEARVLAGGEPVLGRLERSQAEGGPARWTEISTLPLRDPDGAVIGTFGIAKDVTTRQALREELEQTRRRLIDASRTAGMAEVATGVLHNVGNVLTSLNVSASVVATGLRQSKAETLGRVSALFTEHRDDLGAFLTTDPKGQRIPEFLASLARHSVEERDHLLNEVASLQENIDHIKEIVTMQQAYATMAGVREPLDPVKLMEDSLRMNLGALARHEVDVEREFELCPPVLAEKGKVLQILINLIRNAKYAADEGRAENRRVTLRVARSGPDHVELVVADNGIGISPETMPKIFTHGYTTRAGGHGFGLHSAALAAKELGGTLVAASPGAGLGATFTLSLPVAPTP
jgi:PAS domain S-box-containing protein